MEKIIDDGGVLEHYWLKAFDCIPHDRIIVRLESYGFHIDLLKLIHDYLSNRKQRIKANGTYSSWTNTFYGVSQGSILGPLLFNIHLCDLFFFLVDLAIASYVDDTTIWTGNE